MGAQFVIRVCVMRKNERKTVRIGMWNETKSYELIALLSVFAFLFLMWMFTGKWPLDANSYNSYALQADAWRQGRLDLGQNYSWLELAIYEGKYYVSFPPFPSYLLFPITFLFGSNTPDNLILCVVIALLVVYCFRLGKYLGLEDMQALVGTLLVVIGSNQVFVMFDASVWFLAQTLSFTLAVMAIYYTLKGKGGTALFLWACSVGCRPMQAVFLPVLLVVLYQNEKHRAEEGDRHFSVFLLLKEKWRWIIPPGIMGMSYMLLNFARFGNPMEFGHNYLPEFTEAELGQFHVNYMANNIKMLFHLPEFSQEGMFQIDHFGNLSMLIVSPVFVLFFVYIIMAVIKKEYPELKVMMLILSLSVVYMLIVVMHRTMGGWHFGNRYSNDLLPFIYFGMLLFQRKYPGLWKYQIPFCIWGMCINAIGSVVVYNGWGR